MARRISCLFVVAWLLSSVAFGAEGRIPIFSTTGVFNIDTESGSYFLAGNFDGRILISVSHVTIDLNGCTLTVPAGQKGISSGSVTDVTIKNGKIYQGAEGIEFINMASDSEITIEDVMLVGQTDSGVVIYGGIGHYVRAVLLRNMCFGANYPIIMANVRGSLIEGNQARGGANATVSISGSSSNTIRNNVFTEGVAMGLALAAAYYNLVEGNTLGGAFASGKTKQGLHLDTSDGNRIVNNSVSNNSEDGIYLYGSSYNTISNNTASRNGSAGSPSGCGIRIVGGDYGSTGNVVEWNQTGGNSGALGYGIRFDMTNATGNVYSHNRSYGNQHGAYSEQCSPSCNTNIAGTNYP